MNNYVQRGDTVTHTVAGAAVVSGQVLLTGSILGICATSQEIGEEVELQVVGVFSVPKKSADTPAAFAKAYWDDTNKEVTTTASTHKILGVFTEAVAAGVLVASVRLNGISV